MIATRAFARPLLSQTERQGNPKIAPEALGQRSTSNVYRVLEATGGIAPTQRHRAPRVLSFAEREEISRGVAAGETCRTIARRLSRAVSTVSQELARHGGRWVYRASEADHVAWESARQPKPCLLARNQPLQRLVAVKLRQDWSPQQIAGWLKDQPREPSTKSPSQCPGTARSSTSAGRSRMETAAGMRSPMRPSCA